MKTEFSNAFRNAAQTLAEAQFGTGITLTDPVRHHPRKEVGRWQAKVSEDNVLARFSCPVHFSLRENAAGDMVVEALLDMSTKGDRQGARARAERLRSQGKHEEAEQALAEVRDVTVFDREDVEFQLQRIGKLLKIREILEKKGKTVLYSMQGRRLEVAGDRTIIGAANGGRALYVRPAGSNKRIPVNGIGKAIGAALDAGKARKAELAARDALAKAEAAAAAATAV